MSRFEFHLPPSVVLLETSALSSGWTQYRFQNVFGNTISVVLEDNQMESPEAVDQITAFLRMWMDYE